MDDIKSFSLRRVRNGKEKTFPGSLTGCNKEDVVSGILEFYGWPKVKEHIRRKDYHKVVLTNETFYVEERK